MKLRVNPVLEKECKTKMRGWRAPALLSIYLLFLGCVAVLYFILRNMNNYAAGFDPRTALDIYIMLTMFQLGLLLFITPAITSSTISGERERQTLDLLLCTRISAWSTIFGKLMASLSQIILLVIASIPVFSIVFLYGGLLPIDVAAIFVFQIVTAFFLGSLGIFFSTLFKKTTVATIFTYTVILLLTLGTLLGYAFYSGISHSLFGRAPEYWETMTFLSVNPFIGLGAILDRQTGYFGFIRSILLTHDKSVGNTPWFINISIDIVLSFLLLLFSAWKIKPVKGSKNKKKHNPV